MEFQAACERDGQGSPVVLVVEDEVLIRQTNCEWLRDAGFRVLEAANGSEALDLLASSQPIDLMITDISLLEGGGADGLALTGAARAARPGLPVLIASAQTPAQARDLADAILGKPFGPTDLVSLAWKLIEQTPTRGYLNRNAS